MVMEEDQIHTRSNTYLKVAKNHEYMQSFRKTSPMDM